jgi:hypothetical protein
MSIEEFLTDAVMILMNCRLPVVPEVLDALAKIRRKYGVMAEGR